MSEYITAKHTYNAGDLLTILPGFQKIYRETGKKVKIYQRLNFRADYGHKNYHPIVDQEGNQVCMNQYMFDMLKPLIEMQEYVESFEVWNGEKVDFDFDLTRQHTQMPLPGGSIHAWATLIFPQLQCDLGEPWIRVQKNKIGYLSRKYIFVNRTHRYRNDYISFHFLKPYQDIVRFVGTDEEHERFNKENNLDVECLYPVNFYQLGLFMDWNCMFFIGNQSFAFHLADALKIPRILEVCQFYPNTFPTGDKGHSFITQNALEYQFNLLLNETPK